jgi:two-component sensor histidine kinase
VQPIHEQRFLRLDGSVFDVEVSAIAIQFDGQPALQTAAHDITERKRAKLALQISLRDKEALLNEVHHRVKNNLQVISSLLRLEAGRSKQPETSCVMQEMQGRIRTMAQLYETLYRTGSFASVNLADYLKHIATQVFRAQSHGAVQLQLALNPVQVNMDMATPCGLLVNELISNGLKHAFPDGRPGELMVSLQPVRQTQTPEPTWCLSVSDNGVGLPTNFEQRRGQSLGLQLACDLARQLGSVLDIHTASDATSGSSFSVLFAPNNSGSGRVQLPAIL